MVSVVKASIPDQILATIKIRRHGTITNNGPHRDNWKMPTIYIRQLQQSQSYNLLTFNMIIITMIITKCYNQGDLSCIFMVSIEKCYQQL